MVEYYKTTQFHLKKEIKVYMKDLRDIIAKNIQALRVSKKITQFRLAEALNYSDKAVSKWERAESMPDVAVLKQIADYFGVTVDYLLTEDHTGHAERMQNLSAAARHNRFIISALSVSLVWFVAVFTFVFFKLTQGAAASAAWLSFVYAVPCSSIVWLIFNSIWGNTRRNFLIISVMVWSLIASLYLSLLVFPPYHSVWPIFFLGIPAQIIIFLWSRLRARM